MQQPLSGLTVLDLSRLFPGPFATMVLRDLGARVIKIESPSAPDILRFPPPYLDGSNVGFSTLNRNKESLMVEITQPEGAEIVGRLARRADVLLTSTRPGFLEKFGLGHQQLSADNPGLITCSLRGYASHSPEGQKGGHDINFLALSGLSDLLRDESGTPQVAKFQLGDIAGSLSTVIAILAALVQRGQCGQGQALELSISESCRAFTVLLEALALHHDECDPSLTEPLSGKSPVYRYYRCKDGRYLALGAIELKFQRALLHALDIKDRSWPEDLFFNWSETEQVHHAMEELFASQDQQSWLAFFAEYDVCLTPVLSVEEATQRFDSGQTTQTSEGGQARQPKGLLGRCFPSAEPGRAAYAPGFHNSAILKELGYDPATVEALRDRGVVV